MNRLFGIIGRTALAMSAFNVMAAEKAPKPEEVYTPEVLAGIAADCELMKGRMVQIHAESKLNAQVSMAISIDQKLTLEEKGILLDEAKSNQLALIAEQTRLMNELNRFDAGLEKVSELTEVSGAVRLACNPQSIVIAPDAPGI